MPRVTKNSPQPGGRLRADVDSLLLAFSVYAVPIAVALVTVVSLFLWDSQYPASDSIGLNFTVVEETGQQLDPKTAHAQLIKRWPVEYFDTNRSEAPFWFQFSTQSMPVDAFTAVELPSRHARNAKCWDTQDFSLLGSANRAEVSGTFEHAKAGMAIQLASTPEPRTLVCVATFVGPARISVVQWPAAQLESSIQKFHRNSGLLDGGMILLAIFVLVAALINREWTFVVFAMWLVANLRMASISSGWDTQWLEHIVPEQWTFPMRKLTAASYFVLTATLFSRLFRDDLEKVGYEWLWKAAQWSCVPLVVVAITVPFSGWLLWLWASVAFGVSVIVFFLVRIIVITRSSVAIFYGASLGMTLLVSLYEVLAAALGLKALIGTVNFVTASLSSSLLAALAIAEQMRQERLERVRAQAELRSTYEAIPIGLFTLDTSGEFLRSNPALNAMLDIDPSSNRPEYWGDHFEPGAWSRLQDLVHGSAIALEIQAVATEDEEPKWFLVEATLANDKIEGSLQDITERAKATARLRFLAENDPLTNVLNRRGIEKAFDFAMQEVAAGRPLALAYLDLDRFKLTNDLFGHLAGDEVLKQVCARIKENLKDAHDLGRIGGDEFVILFRDTPFAEATGICQLIVERVATMPYRMGDKAFQIKGSIGLVEVSQGVRVKDAISAADRACREAKQGLHGDLVVYEKDAPVFKQRLEELRLVEHLGAGVAPAGLFLVMQPLLSVNAPFDSLNFEILLRMRETDGSIAPAYKIISAAENNGRTAVIDRWVMSNTLEWLDANHDRLEHTQFACMNLSGGSLNDERFIDDAFAMLAQHGRAAKRLCVEITESVALHDLANTRRFIDKVRSYGAKIALDDFGAGYTSFNYLKELQADTLKIDGSYVVGVNRHPANLSIVQAIAELARNLGMKCVAEWAEDLATLETLAEVGVDYVQGYVVSRPQLPEQILAATSSASFIADEKVASFVRDFLATGQTGVMWDQLKRHGSDMH